jgi:hypothetical protein
MCHITCTHLTDYYFPYKGFFPHWAHADSSFTGASDVSGLQTVPYNCTFGAPDKGLKLEVCQVQTAESGLTILWGGWLTTSALQCRTAGPCRTGHSYVGAWNWTDQTHQIPWGLMDTLHGTPRLERSHLSLVNSLIKFILVLLAKLYLHSPSINFFQTESACSSSSSCHAVSLVWSKGFMQAQQLGQQICQWVSLVLLLPEGGADCGVHVWGQHHHWHDQENWDCQQWWDEVRHCCGIPIVVVLLGGGQRQCSSPRHQIGFKCNNLQFFLEFDGTWRAVEMLDNPFTRESKRRPGATFGYVGNVCWVYVVAAAAARRQQWQTRMLMAGPCYWRGG